MNAKITGRQKRPRPDDYDIYLLLVALFGCRPGTADDANASRHIAAADTEEGQKKNQQGESKESKQGAR